MLPARGPRPMLKGETVLSLRLMDDVQVPQLAKTFGPNWHFFTHAQNDSYQPSAYDSDVPQLAVRTVSVAVGTSQLSGQVQASYASVITRTLPSTNVAPGMPVFVLNTGTVLAVSGYGYQDSRISYSLVGGGTGVIDANDIDWTSTTRLNEKRGVRLSLHNKPCHHQPSRRGNARLLKMLLWGQPPSAVRRAQLGKVISRQCKLAAFVLPLAACRAAIESKRCHPAGSKRRHPAARGASSRNGKGTAFSRAVIRPARRGFSRCGSSALVNSSRAFAPV